MNTGHTMKVTVRVILSSIALLVGLTQSAIAEVTITKHSYLDGEDKLLGEVVQDETQSGSRPLIVMFHDWMGPSSETEQEARRVATLGYVVFIADIYGANVRPSSVEQASSLSGHYKEHRDLMRKRALAALAEARLLPGVSKDKVAAIGYCFGGTVALELGRTGADLLGIVSVHGGLSTPDKTAASHILGRVLVLHGADDPFVAPAEVDEFEKEMKLANRDFQIVKYPGAVHAFTNEGVDALGLKGASYNADADKNAFAAMKKFFGEIFGN